MIRYINLKGQATGYAFAFWDTVTDRFLQIGTDQAWDSLADLNESMDIAGTDPDLAQRLRSHVGVFLLKN